MHIVRGRRGDFSDYLMCSRGRGRRNCNWCGCRLSNWDMVVPLGLGEQGGEVVAGCLWLGLWRGSFGRSFGGGGGSSTSYGLGGKLLSASVLCLRERAVSYTTTGGTHC
jgi:hypothetical protein